MTTSSSSTTPTPMDTSNTDNTAANNNSTTTTKELEPSDQAVLEYLKQKGLTRAVLELEQTLHQTTTKDSTDLKSTLEHDDATQKSSKSIWSKSTGGGIGHDRDAAVPIAQWGVPDSYPTDGIKSTQLDDQGNPLPLSQQLGVQEARNYLDAYCALVIWVLSLPDHGTLTKVPNVLQKTQDLLNQQEENKNIGVSTTQRILQALGPPQRQTQTQTTNEDITTANLPPSAKPELLSICFALWVHTYCELLEVGMESTAHVLRDAFGPLFQPLYESETKDLYLVCTTEDIMRLNTLNSQHMEVAAQLKALVVQLHTLQTKHDELSVKRTNSSDAEQLKQTKLKEYQQTSHLLQQRHAELAQRASIAYDRVQHVPFLRRARAVRWQLSLSATSYSLLVSFLSSGDLLCMSTLLQTKCEVHVEPRDPWPIVPSFVLDDKNESTQLNERHWVAWATPSVATTVDSSKGHFPKYHLDSEYDDDRSARKDQRTVAFNRALVMHGFRRLQAIERKREYASLNHESSESNDEPTTTSVKIANALEPSIVLSTLGSSSTSSTSTSTSSTTPHGDVAAIWDDASSMGLTCAAIAPPDGRRIAVGCDDSAVRVFTLNSDTFQNNTEPTQVLLGHKNGFPVFDVSWNRDGRCLLSAGGDGSVRLWDTQLQGPFGSVVETFQPSSTTLSNSNKNKTPAALDKAATVHAKKALEAATQIHQKSTTPNLDVPGLIPEPQPTTPSGAALAVYRGHAPNTPVWSVSFAPSGYYFLSGGADGTARVWTTDRAAPVRILAGHTSKSIHSTCFHPNGNYVLTGSEDKTARLWDIQSGRCVRLLTGCSAGVNVVQVSPSGQYAAGADYHGNVHLWELGTGKKVSQFMTTTGGASNKSGGTIHSLAFSPCGKALATGGDDCCVRIWDVQNLNTCQNDVSVQTTPTKTFATQRTVLMDLRFTRRNLLLSTGKVVLPVPFSTLSSTSSTTTDVQ